MSTDTQALNTIRHGQYYIPNADLCLIVEQFIFKIHRYFFERESEYFARKLAVPTSAGGALPGSADHSAIILDNVTPSQFSNFLWVFYNPKFSLYEADLPVWQDILVLAHRWIFPEVKSLAVREIEKKHMADVMRIKLYQDNQVDRNLLVCRYAALTERDEPINLEEGIAIGLETVLKIAAAREKARGVRLANGSLSPSTPTARGADLFEVIRDVFKIDETAGTSGYVPSAITTVPAGGLKPLNPPPVLAKPVPAVPVPEVKAPVVKKPTPTPQESTPSPLPQNLTKKEQQKLKQQQQADTPVNTKTSSNSTPGPQVSAQEPPTTNGPTAPQAKKGTTKKAENKNKKNAKGAMATQEVEAEPEVEVVKVQAKEEPAKVEVKEKAPVKVKEKTNGESAEVKVVVEPTQPEVPAKDATKPEEEAPLIDVVPPSASMEPPVQATRPPQPPQERLKEGQQGVKVERTEEQPNVEEKQGKPLPVDPAAAEASTSETTTLIPDDSTTPLPDIPSEHVANPPMNIMDTIEDPLIPETPIQTKPTPVVNTSSPVNSNGPSRAKKSPLDIIDKRKLTSALSATKENGSNWLGQLESWIGN
ncbi:hypothetical protein BJ165DRAFT_1113979 [Panaeolus papilionaceus]|nr:hypothetical protein BJ165DRAFT_1113979 [Panaeolus papilionaceus]